MIIKYKNDVINLDCVMCFHKKYSCEIRFESYDDSYSFIFESNEDRDISMEKIFESYRNQRKILDLCEYLAFLEK